MCWLATLSASRAVSAAAVEDVDDAVTSCAAAAACRGEEPHRALAPATTPCVVASTFAELVVDLHLPAKDGTSRREEQAFLNALKQVRRRQEAVATLHVCAGRL